MNVKIETLALSVSQHLKRSGCDNRKSGQAASRN